MSAILGLRERMELGIDTAQQTVGRSDFSESSAGFPKRTSVFLMSQRVYPSLCLGDQVSTMEHPMELPALHLFKAMVYFEMRWKQRGRSIKGVP